MGEALDVQYISNNEGKVTGVIVPIDIWEEISAELETAYLLRSAPMKKRLLDARNRQNGIPFEVALEKLGI